MLRSKRIMRSVLGNLQHTSAAPTPAMFSATLMSDSTVCCLRHQRAGCGGAVLCSLAGVNFNIDQCSPNGTDPYKPKCPETNEDSKEPIFPEWLTVILLCLYLLFTNILLLNLLIAMFK